MQSWHFIVGFISLVALSLIIGSIVRKRGARRTWLKLQRQCDASRNVFLQECRELVCAHASALLSQSALSL